MNNGFSYLITDGDDTSTNNMSRKLEKKQRQYKRNPTENLKEQIMKLENIITPMQIKYTRKDPVKTISQKKIKNRMKKETINRIKFERRQKKRILKLEDERNFDKTRVLFESEVKTIIKKCQFKFPNELVNYIINKNERIDIRATDTLHLCLLNHDIQLPFETIDIILRYSFSKNYWNNLLDAIKPDIYHFISFKYYDVNLKHKLIDKYVSDTRYSTKTMLMCLNRINRINNILSKEDMKKICEYALNDNKYSMMLDFFDTVSGLRSINK